MFSRPTRRVSLRYFPDDYLLPTECDGPQKTEQFTLRYVEHVRMLPRAPERLFSANTCTQVAAGASSRLQGLQGIIVGSSLIKYLEDAAIKVFIELCQALQYHVICPCFVTPTLFSSVYVLFAFSVSSLHCFKSQLGTWMVVALTDAGHQDDMNSGWFHFTRLALRCII